MHVTFGVFKIVIRKGIRRTSGARFALRAQRALIVSVKELSCVTLKCKVTITIMNTNSNLINITLYIKV